MESKTVFVEVFGNNPIIKVLDFLITFQLFDYPLTEIAKNSGVVIQLCKPFGINLKKIK